jgi:hypothetical protein
MTMCLCLCVQCQNILFPLRSRTLFAPAMAAPAVAAASAAVAPVADPPASHQLKAGTTSNGAQFARIGQQVAAAIEKYKD